MSTATLPLLAMKTSTKIKKFLCLFASLFGQWLRRVPGAAKGGMACKLQLTVAAAAATVVTVTVFIVAVVVGLTEAYKY